MVLVKGIFALIALIAVSLAVVAATFGPAIAYFVWGWKVAFAWLLIVIGLNGFMQALKSFTSSDE